MDKIDENGMEELVMTDVELVKIAEEYVSPWILDSKPALNMPRYVMVLYYLTKRFREKCNLPSHPFS